MTHLLVEDGLGLTTITGLLSVVTTLSLREEGILALLVLGHLMGTIFCRTMSEYSEDSTASPHTCASCMFCPCSLIFRSQLSEYIDRFRHCHLQVLRVL